MNIKSPICLILVSVPITLMVVGALVLTGVIDPNDPKYKKAFGDAVARGKKFAKHAHKDVQNVLTDLRSDLSS